MEMAIDALIRRARELKNPSVVGLDTRLDLMPETIVWHPCFKGKTSGLIQSAASAIFYINTHIIDAICDIVPAVKLQIAFYEQLGSYGVATFIDTVKYAKSKGMIVIGDIKRGDIASTAEAYANGHLGKVKVEDKEFSVYEEDFSTVNPYMGGDSIEPFLKVCRENGKGIFILVKNSNPGSGQIQDLRLADRGGIPLYEEVASLVSGWGADQIGECGYSAVGAVVGATHPAQARRLRELMPHTLFLAPGYGAQGAKASDLVDGSIVNSSRGIIGAWKTPPYCDQFVPEQFADAARAAALDMREDLACLKI